MHLYRICNHPISVSAQCQADSRKHGELPARSAAADRAQTAGGPARVDRAYDANTSLGVWHELDVHAGVDVGAGNP